MNIKEFLEYKRKNPETTPDFLFSVSKKEVQQYDATEKDDIKTIHNVFSSICETQKQNYKYGTKVQKMERLDLKIFIS